MQQHRIISLASIVVMLLIPVIGWFLVAQPQFAAAAAADQQRVATEAQIATSSAIVAQLKADSARLPELNADLNELRTSIPAGVDPSGYIDGLDALARISKVNITALTVADPTAYTPAVPAIDPNAVAPDANGEEGAAETPATPATIDPAFTTSPLIDSTNFVAIPVTIEVAGEWGPILRFIQGLQSSDRLFLVSTLETANDGGSSITSKIGGFIYAIPTGIEGNPRPTSTIVKQMDAVEEAVEDETDEEPETPNPDPTETPAP
jgi:Tfp pilus assembly protein PilO